MDKFIVALTGGIGSGKTSVSRLFSELGIDVIDTDIIAREIVKPNSLALTEIINHFGKSIIDKQGEINRKILREIIFQDPKEKIWLENLLHPLIRKEMWQQIQKSQSPYCIVVIPLLFENETANQFNRILVVDAPKELQIKRTMERDNTEKAQVEKIIRTQVPNEIKCQKADDVIKNTGSLEELAEKVEKLHQLYLNLGSV